MSWHYLQGRAAASWAGACLDGAPSALLSLIPMHGRCCSPDSATDSCTGSPYGMTSQHSTATHGAGTSTSSQGAFRAKTSAAQEKGQVFRAAARAYGAKCRGSFARFDRDSHLWKTHQCSLLEASTSYSGIWPRWGIMRDGACSELDTLAPRTSEIGSGSRRNWATPTARDWKDSPGMSFVSKSGRKRLDLLPRQVYYLERAMLPTPVADDTGHRTKKYAQGGQALSMVIGGKLNPNWVAWLMGWPVGWTDCEPLATDKFRLWLRSHGAS